MAKKEAVEFNPATMGNDLKNFIREASNAKVQIEAHNDHIRDIKTRAKEELGVDGKMFGKLLKIYHKQERDSFEGEAQEVLDLYDATF